MEKYGFVYIWRDKKYNRYYIGAHWGNEHDKYICSSTWMRNSYKRRPQDFKRKILETNISNKIDLFDKEYKWLCFITPSELGKKYYNRAIFNFNSKGYKTFHSDESREKLRQANLGRICSDEIKEKIRLANTGRKHTDEYKENIRKYRLGKKWSEETKQKMSIAKKGKKRGPMSEETKQKLRISQLSKKKD